MPIGRDENMTIWNPQEWKEIQEVYADFKELMELETQMQIRKKCLVDRAWNIYYEANKFRR